MKTIKFHSPIKSINFSLLVISLLIMISCDKLPHGGGPILKKAKVETLVNNFEATDGLSVDRSGNIYASNFSAFTGTTVLKTNPFTGQTSVAVDSLVAPLGNTTDRQGNIYVVNNIRFLSREQGTTQADVLKVAPDGSREVLATLPGFPAGIVLDRNNNAYVSNFDFPAIHKVAPNGDVSILVQDERLRGGVGIDFDKHGNLIVGNFATGDIFLINPNLEIKVLATIPTVVEGFVIGYITYFAGSVFATAISEHVIYKVSMSGEVTVFAGNGTQETVDGSLEGASFNGPNGIAADPIRKRIYISENSGEGALRVIKFQ
ncbi:NHL repeat-containing protein [Costertonia aggregata]|uniref:SMP-30/gluconolactonase/LRE family protein n=1 Tax=Costertonia aggregata TaxID=343403 RepID=A0A7H9AN44_9FLAO|nr:hypothetical protein [Costertonia aggregata]QLG44858.1 hypothetical protein HYG79_05655 [Costertonia aggregata]